MTLILDSGALIALERNDRAMWRRYKALMLAGQTPVTHGGIVAQAWRGGPRQARLAKALDGIDVRALDGELGRSAGELLARAGTADAIDAALALLAEDGDEIATSDPDDLASLTAVLDRHVEIRRV